MHFNVLTAVVRCTNELVVEHMAAECMVLCCQMSVIFNEAGLSDIQPPCVVQTFVNHNARLFKIFLIGRRRFIIQRPSIKNLFAGGNFTQCGTRAAKHNRRAMTDR